MGHNVLWIPGGGVKPLNQLEGMPTQYRLDVAYDAWKTGTYSHIMLSGGSPGPPDVQTASEAWLMYCSLVDRGYEQPPYPESNLLLEDRSWHSYANVAHSRKILHRDLGLNSIDEIAVVTHITHWRRLRITFHAYGIHQIRHIAVDYDLTPKQLKDEGTYLALHYLDPKGWFVGSVVFNSMIRAAKLRGGGRTT